MIISKGQTTAILSIGITTLTSFEMFYISGLIGYIIYLFSILFLLAFVAVNLYYKQKIENLSDKKFFSICFAYFLVIPLFQLINSFKPPSIFLMSLFFLYFSLTLIWILLAEKRVFTNVCVVLLIFCLLPLFCSCYVHFIHETQISDELKYLENQIEYYENHLNDLNYGVLTKDRTDFAKDDLEELKRNTEEAKDYYLNFNFLKAWEKIEDAREIEKSLNRTFDLLAPVKVLYDELHRLEKELDKLNYSAYFVKCRAESLARQGQPEYLGTMERILSDIKVAKKNIDSAWFLYRNGDFKETYNFIQRINVDIYHINSRLDWMEIATKGFEAILAIIGLLIIYLIKRKKRGSQHTK